MFNMTQKSDFLCEDISSSVQEVHSIIKKITKMNKRKTTKKQKTSKQKKTPKPQPDKQKPEPKYLIPSFIKQTPYFSYS